MEDLADVVRRDVIECLGEIAFDELDAIRQRRIRGHTLLGERTKLRLNETERDIIRAREHARKKLGAEKPGETGEEDGHECRVAERRRPRRLMPAASRAAAPVAIMRKGGSAGRCHISW